MTSQLDSTGTAAVDHNYFWQPIHTCPRGVKVQLLGKGGVAMYGSYTGKDDFYTHWCPLPKLKREAAPIVKDMCELTLKIQLADLAQKGCGDCFSQDCVWPNCVPKAKAITEILETK